MFASLLAVLTPALSSAAVSISVTSPQPGQPLYDVTPTITVAYSSSGAPLNLASLTIHVNGTLWTNRFTVGPTSASYQVPATEAFVAGRLTITAQIRDQATPPVSAAVTQEYDLFPTFQAVTPAVGSPGDTITLRGLGLDLQTGHNQALFPNPFGSTPILVPLASVGPVAGDAEARQGTAVVPEGSTSGVLGLSTNSLQSREQIPFTIPPPVTRCGYPREFHQLASGAWLVHYDRYMGGWTPPTWQDPRCPRLNLVTCCNQPCGAVTYMDLSGNVSVLEYDHYNCSFADYVDITAMAVRKSGVGTVTVAHVRQPGVGYKVRASYGGTYTYPSGLTARPLAVDFDSTGNVYFADRAGLPYETQLRIWELTKAQVTNGGEATPRLVASMEMAPLGAFGVLSAQLVVGCDGFGYVAAYSRASETGSSLGNSTLMKLDLQTGAILDSTTGMSQREIVGLSLSCHTNELWGLTRFATTTDVWRAEISSEPHDIGPLQVQQTLPNVSYPGWITFQGITIAGQDDLHVGFAGRFDVGMPPGVLPLSEVEVEPCGQGEASSSLPLCAVEVTIRPETTRWRPQRSTTGVVEVHFEGPRGLTPATTLQITGPDGPLSGMNLAFEVVDGQSDPARYKITWSGPWQAGTPPAYLPRGNYRVQVRGVMPDESIVTSSPSDANATVSMVEVTGVELCQPDDTTSCSALITPYAGVSVANPAVGTLQGQDPPQDREGGGKRIFAESVVPNGPVLDTVKVRATIAPAIADLRGQSPVTVYFKPLDADDPAPYVLPDLDGDQGPVADNRGLPREGIIAASSTTVATGATTTQTYFRVPGPGGAGGGQPGDNYRVVASTSPTWLQAIQAVQPSPRGELNLAPAEAATAASEMLTVWRTLHLELDAMGSAPINSGDPNYAERNLIRGRITGIDEVQTVGSEPLPTRIVLEPEPVAPLLVDDGSKNLSGDFRTFGCGRFEKGMIQVGSDGTGAIRFQGLDGNGVDFVRKRGRGAEPCAGDGQQGFAIPFQIVDRNGANPISGRVLEWVAPDRRFTLSINVNPSVYGEGRLTVAGVTWRMAAIAGPQVTVVEERPFPFHLVDDDDVRDLALVTSRMQSSDDPVANAYAQAYIRPRYDVSNPRPQPSFNRNISEPLGPDGQPNVQDFIDQIGRGRDSAVSVPRYWVMYAQGAFQHDEQRDFDPRSERIGSTLGQNVGLDFYGSMVYVEAVRDHRSLDDGLVAACAAATLVHEFGHQFDLRDRNVHENGHMSIRDCVLGPFYFTAEELAKIRAKGVQ